MTNEVKKKKNRSTAYPAISLDKAVEAIRKIREALGKDSYSREAMAGALNYKGGDGHASRVIAALVQFGLLKREGSAYHYNDLSDQILYYESKDNEAMALSGAVKSPKLYKSLILKYSNQALPSLLNGVLVRDFAINPKVSSDVVKDFIKSIEFAGLYKNGVISDKFNDLVGEINIEENNGNVKSIEDNTPHSNTEFSQKNILKTDSTEFKILELPSGAIIYYPSVLAYEFATGVLSEEIKALNEKIQKIMQTKNI